MKVFILALLLAAAGAAYYFFIYRPAHSVLEAAYVLPRSVEVTDSPAEVHLVIGTLRHGDRVEALARTRNWAKVRLADGEIGWVEAKNLLDEETFQAGQHLLGEIQAVPTQAVGHLTTDTSLRLNPSRDAQELADLDARQSVEIVGRSVTERASKTQEGAQAAASEPENPQAEPEKPLRDVWYLVRADSSAGWLIGRYVALDIPDEIGPYAQDVNTVAWLVLDQVEDGGRKIPQYLVADRIETQDFDFNHIRVFTWWPQKQRYATAYVESGLNGYFPIRVELQNGIPYFRLRLMDAGGRKYQKVYGLFDTIVRPLGTLGGWENDALPEPRPQRSGRKRR